MHFETFLPSELFDQLDACGDLDKIAPEMLKKAAPLLRDSIRKRAAMHDRSGEMSKSVKMGKPIKHRRTGNWGLKVNFTGYDNKSHKPTTLYPQGVPNAIKAAGIEYGNRDGREEAHPFLDAAAKDATPAVLSAMQQTYTDEVSK